ncbi:DUF4157 domain-containing protein [Exilibacterium tricleocarpae]|uniref:DUF4157 domain-containing protein n=2 Tax=Exilibacterium tricleocarpae TaxID=2591008 RepID=A0A545TZU1_9GAMM|nr:DUF4157 domain-containing protein [Exilibacterium tricleocarpae]TQV82727.1 DUF4157 domain-containing protein [Exilibacterium tricleocarpae]
MNTGTCSNCQSKPSPSNVPPVLKARLRISGASRASDSNTLSSVVNQPLSSRGQPLDPGVRSYMESGFRQDFSHVRVHTGERAARSARAVNALAYTVGRNIVFGTGQYSTHSTGGRKLLAHELAHVAQQGRAAMSGAPAAVAGSRFEHEADTAARSVVEGRRPEVLQSSSRPLFARQQARHTLPQADGSEVIVSRFITPGNCRLRPETRTTVSGDITRSGAFLEVTSCRGNVSGGGRGELNYDQALNDAGRAAANLLTNLAGGRPPGDAFDTFRRDISNVSPEAQLRFNLDLPGVRAQISGTASGSLAGGVSGTGRARVEVDVGPLTVGVEPSVTGGTNDPTEGRVMVTVGNRRSRTEPNCFVCACSEPQIVHRCSLRPPPQAPAPRLQSVIIPLFFEFEETTPRPGWERRYADMLQLAVSRIGQGYRIERIVGNASPEGAQRPRSARARFRGNIDLAQRRAQEARDDLNRALQAALGGLQMRGLANIRAALSSQYPVEGRGELFGTAGTGEVADPALRRHLQTTLRTPAAGEVDPLEERDVLSEDLPAGVRAEVGGVVEDFRAGNRNPSALFPFFRRALIYLEPPAPVVDFQLSPEAIRQIIGDPIPCAEEHIRALTNANPLPSTGMFRGEQCNRPGQRP